MSDAYGDLASAVDVLIHEDIPPAFAVQTLTVGQTLTVVCQYDRILFDGPIEYPYAYDPATHFIPMAVERFERVLRQAVEEASR